MPSEQRIGCWIRNGTRLSRSPVSGESLHFWADFQELELLPGQDTIVLIGESTARGYFYDPMFTPAAGLQHLLATVLTETDYQILDFARTNASLQDVLTLVRAVSVLQPRAVVIWAGNNWFPFENITPADAPAVAAVIRSGASALDVRAHLEALHRRRVQSFIEEAGALVHNMGADGILVIPEFNLLGWHDAVDEAPPVGRERRARWAEARRELLRAQAAGNYARVATFADELLALDGGLGSLGLHTKALLHLQDDPSKARALLEESHGAEIWPKSPRCHRITSAELRKHGPAHGFVVVDLPRRFADYSASPVPSPDLFLDYCHHSQEGLRVACASIAQTILQCLFGISSNWQDLAARTLSIPRAVEACAQFLAAVHNSAYAQPAETLRRHLEKGIDADPDVQTAMRQYACHRLGCAAHALAAGHMWNRQVERYLGPAEIRRGPFDLQLVNMILTRSGGPGDMAELAIRHALTTKAVDLLQPAFGQLIIKDESTLETCGYYRSRRSTSSFNLVVAKPASVILDLSYRTPDAAASSVVQVICGSVAIAQLRASSKWNHVQVTVPAFALRPGINSLRVEWPSSVLDGHEILARYADALDLGESPVAPYPILGEIFTFRANLQ